MTQATVRFSTVCDRSNFNPDCIVHGVCCDHARIFSTDDDLVVYDCPEHMLVVMRPNGEPLTIDRRGQRH